VRSRDGGFVTRNCLRCEASDYVGLDQLPELTCEWCGKRLQKEVHNNKNYWYKYSNCGRQWELASVLPHWSDLFSYRGIAAPGDSAFPK
jgi:hypothetical protein